MQDRILSKGSGKAPWFIVLPLLLVLVAPAAAQEGAVGGVVISEQTGQPLAGVRVAVEGSQRAALTDASGRFLLTGVPAGEVRLRASFLGYRSQTVRARAGDLNVEIVLADQAIELDAIVVTGTAGDGRTRTLGNAIGQIRAAEVVETMPIRTVQDLIRARAPGVAINPGSGMVGGGAQIQIRGISSLSLSTRPLLYVDGVRVDNAGNTGPGVQGLGNAVVSRLNDFNPDDIEHIEIIKGPAAATLYGTEAANGVIHIITKRGGGGEPQFNARVRQGVNWFADAEGRMPVSYWRNPATGEVESLNIVAQEKARGTPIFRPGHLQGYDLSVQGGADNVRYYLSGSMDDEQGVERPNTLARWSGRANLTIAAHERLDVAANLGYMNSDNRLVWEGSGGGVMWSAVQATPARLRRADGSEHPARGFRTAPHEYFDHYQVSQEASRFTGSIQLNHRPTDWLSQRLTVGTDRGLERNIILVERTDRLEQFFGTLLGNKTAGRREVENNTFDYAGTAIFHLSDRLSSSTSFGAQYYHRSTTSITASGQEFPAPGLTVVNAAAIQRGSESFVENATVGIFAQQQFGWNDRLFLTAALRADDNSAFGENFELVYYPKASLSWVASEEPFWAVPGVSTLRFRTAYGESGQQPEAFAALRTYSPVTGRGDGSAVTPSTIGNPNLGPERGKEVEVGFDAGFLEERIGLQFTYYNQRTADAIVLRSIAPSAGFSGSQWVNVGEIANRGMELLLDANVVARPNVNWNVAVNFGTNDNEVRHLGADLETLVLNAQFGWESRVGYPASSFFHKRILSAEINASGFTENLMCDGGPSAGGQPVPCDDAPRVFLGQTIPTYEGGLSTTLMLFDRLQLGGVVDFKGGHVKWNGDLWVQCSIFWTCRDNVYPQEADPVQLAAFHRDLAIQSPYVNDASFARLREVSASYTLPRELVRRVGAGSASLSVAGRNLHTWTRYPGMDPEVAYGHNWYQQNNLPQLAQFVTTLNVSF
jgi:TonB-linked SusC/RagA family outer membrane protein